jgi:hypothetical protein
MKFRVLALAAAFSAVAGAALADGAAQATLRSPLAKPVDVIAGDAYWSCQGTVCASGAATDQSRTVSGCKELVKVVGALSAYTVAGVALPEAQLAKCNTAAKK